MRKRHALLATALLLISSSVGAQEGDCPDLAQRLAGIDALLERRPEDATVHFYKALFLARCGKTTEAAASLADVGRHGHGFLPVRDFGFEPIWDEEEFQAARAKLESMLPEVIGAEVAFEADGRDLIPEGIAYDEATDRLYMGSMNRNEVLVLSRDGSQRQLAGPDEGLGQILGLVVDRKRGQLLAVDIGPLVENPEERRTGAVVAFDIESGEVERRLPAEGAAQLNDVTVAPDGTIYATDSGSGNIRRAGPEATALEIWPPEPALPGANGLALSADGSALYVAHSTGVGRIDLATGEIQARLDNDTRETLGAIDGLYARGNRLYGIQNVTNPGRVIAIELDEPGRRVVSVETLLSHHHPALDEPTTGALAGDRLLILANSHVARLQPDGTIRDEDSVRSPVILSVAID